MGESGSLSRDMCTQVVSFPARADQQDELKVNVIPSMTLEWAGGTEHDAQL